MHRASTLLTTARLDKELTLEDISQKTKIPTKYLAAIESEDAAALPPEPYCSLIVKDYAKVLGLNGQNILSLFCRDVRGKIRPPNFIRKTLSFTPQFAFGLITILSLIIFLGYLGFEYLEFNRPPRLQINWPDKIINSTLEISGITNPDATLRVNDSLVIVDTTGKFQKKIDTGHSSLKVVVESKSRGGKTAVEERTY